MAAGAGYKVFTAGEVLAATDVNSYLASQVVMVFDTEAARGSAIGTPTQGMISYIKLDDSLQAYDGGAWGAVGGGGAGGFETQFLLMGA